MESAAHIFAIVHLTTMGLSHIAAPKVWARIFIGLREKGEAGAFVVGAMSLLFGSVVVALHQVWSGLGVVLTVVGWMQVLKGLIYFVAPRRGLRSLERVSVERAKDFVWAGYGLLVIAGIVLWEEIGG